MAKKKRLLCDKTEIVGVAYRKVESKGMRKRKLVRFSLTYELIKSIKFEKYEQRRLLGRIPSERILIYERKSPEPYELTKQEENVYFDEYKKDLREFAERHRIKIESV